MAFSASDFHERLPVAYVLHVNGVDVSPGVRLIHCPLHSDSTPSFSIYKDDNGIDRWGCFGCHKGGSCLDLIAAFAGDDSVNPQTFEAAADLLEQYEDDLWEPPTLPERTKLEPTSALDTVQRAQDAVNLEIVQKFIDFKAEQAKVSWKFDAAWLIENFGVGTMVPEQMIIPLFDSNEDVFSYKFWTRPQDIRKVAAGTAFGSDIYYFPLVQDDPQLPVMICEGESDVWNAWHQLGGEVYVYGVLTGAGTRPVALERFKNRTVYLAFDGDRAGRKGTMIWAQALASIAAEVLVVPISPGKDISTTSDLKHAVETARAPVIPPPGIQELGDGSGYGRAGRNGVTPISNWIFEPTHLLVGSEGTAYEGILHPGSHDVVLTTADLISVAKLKRWAQQHGRSWYGTDHDTSLLQGWLQAAASFLPAGEVVTVAGLHRKQFVFPKTTIGSDFVRYTPPVIDFHIEDQIHMDDDPWDISEIEQLREIQKSNTADPILAWLATAPFRSLYKAFPILTITGVHGSGKTTTTEALIRQFSGSHIQATFTSTSPHALAGIVACTNANPVHLDEWRKGARADTMEIARQIFRDAYTAQKSFKGGMSENVMALGEITPSAPIVVTGEASFTEGSHADRMVFIRMHKNKHNYSVFNKIQGRGPTGLPRDYHRWLVETQLQRNDLVSWLNDEQKHGLADLSSRQRWNFHVLHRGWSLLSAFCKDKGLDLGEPNFDEVVSEWRIVNTNNPLDRFIRLALETANTKAGVTMAGGEVTILTSAFQSYVTMSTIVLPGGTETVERDIIDRYNGKESYDPNGRRVIKFNSKQLFINES